MLIHTLFIYEAWLIHMFAESVYAGRKPFSVQVYFELNQMMIDGFRVIIISLVHSVKAAQMSAE